MRGTVKFFRPDLGFGFLLNPEGGPDIFVHWRHLIDMPGFKTLEAGERVEFEPVTTEKGLMATGVRVVVE